MITNRGLKKLIIKMSDLDVEKEIKTEQNIRSDNYYWGYLDGFLRAQIGCIKLVPVK